MLIFGITQRSGNRKKLDVQHRSKDQWCMNDPFISVNTLKVDGPCTYGTHPGEHSSPE